MASPLLTTTSTVQCTHMGSVSAITSNIRVRVSGQPVVTVSDTYTVSGCPFTIPATPAKPQPCVLVRWTVPALRVRVNRQPILLQQSTGICQSIEQIPQGPPMVVMTQLRVRGV
jgi:hypothetical protein